MRPQAIDDTPLYERLETSKLLAMYLLNRGGSKVTPICDNMFGSGKTSLVFKFRSELDKLSRDVWPEKPDNYESLRTAVYLNISFKEERRSSEQPIAWVLDYVRKALTLSCGGRAEFEGDNLPAFLQSLTKAVGSTKFLFHFDDVGCFERYGSAFGAAMIYSIWQVGDDLRTAEHFFCHDRAFFAVAHYRHWAVAICGI